MKSGLVILGTILVAFFYCFETDFADAQVAKEKSCKAIIADLTKRQLGGIGACSKSMKFKNGKDKSKKMNCILRCVMAKEGMLKDDGTITPDHVNFLLIKEFPPSLIDKANLTVTPCAELAYGKLDPNPETDEFCQTYDPAIKCLLSGLPQLCAK